MGLYSSKPDLYTITTSELGAQYKSARSFDSGPQYMNIYGQTNDYAISKDNSAAEVEIYSSSDFSEKEEKPIAYLPQPKINWKKVHMEMMHGNLD